MVFDRQMRSNTDWEKKLNIRTGAGNYEREDANHSPYEPTSYAVLERLANSGYIGRNNVLVDYGSGKGRVGFFLNYVLGCQTIGVEYNETLVEESRRNLEFYAGRHREDVRFICCAAENYNADSADCFYFFNPFSVTILQAVLGQILQSWYENPREMHLFFYFALDSYLDCLMTGSELRYVDAIDCRDIFGSTDNREKILVFKMDPLQEI